MKKILIVVGTRPNFIKITQFPKELSKAGIFEWKIVHTGQHYDDKMSTVFFEQFGIVPDTFLEIATGSPTAQMANIMIGLEDMMLHYKPNIVIVVGDVNSTAAAALAASKLNIRVAHIESGLRSFDKTMPEEYNRIITDNIADAFFVTEQSGIDNLVNEGKKKESLFFVGNTMIDTMVAFEKEIDASDILQKLKIEKRKFVLMTMHRPATVDLKEGLLKLIQLIGEVTKKYKIVFPIHPRTIKNLKEFNLYEKIISNNNLILTEPLGYFSFQKLIKESKFILTDSGGIQEESTFLRVPCLTLRPNTERPVTVSIGSNELLPFDISIVKSKISEIEAGAYKKGNIPKLWDGNATKKIVEVLSRLL